MKKAVTKRLREIAIKENQLAVGQKKLYKQLKKSWKDNMKNGKEK